VGQMVLIPHLYHISNFYQPLGRFGNGHRCTSYTFLMKKSV
jgi:hypothetical protein